MKSFAPPWLALVGACTDVPTFNEYELASIRIDLAAIPAQVPADPSNRVADDPRAALLGAQFFFEDRYSGDGKVSCATCHDPTTGYQDARANTSLGITFTERHAQSITYVALGQRPGVLWEFWDGRVDSQWSQALGPPENPVEMGGSRTRVAYLIFDLYRTDYEAVFGPMPELRDAGGAALFPLDARPGTPEWAALSVADQDSLTNIYANFGKAISAYERLLIPRGSRFDQFHAEIAAGETDSNALTATEKLGLRVFLGKGGCIACHRGPTLSDFAFHNIGIEQIGEHVAFEDRGRILGIEAVRNGEFNCASRWSDHPDKPTCEVSTLTESPADVGAFKTPGLRDLSQSAPYMHTGTFATLEDVVDHYDLGGAELGFSGRSDDRVGPLQLDDVERTALVAFLRSLDGEPLPVELTTPPARPGVP